MIFLAILIMPTVILIATFERALVGNSKPLLLVAFVADVVANFSTLALLFWDWAQYGEWTFSKRLPRLCNLPGWRGRFALRCKDFVNKKVVGHIP